MFAASSVNVQCVNERAAHVKIDRVSCREKSSRWLWKEKLGEKAKKHICVTDRHDMTLVVKVALNPNTTNQPTNLTDNFSSST